MRISDWSSDVCSSDLASYLRDLLVARLGSSRSTIEPHPPWAACTCSLCREARIIAYSATCFPRGTAHHNRYNYAYDYRLRPPPGRSRRAGNGAGRPAPSWPPPPLGAPTSETPRLGNKDVK